MLRGLLVTTLIATGLAQAQPTPLRGAAELQELLDQLGTVGTVLMLGAHPDDENTAVIAHFARGLHLRTVYFSATRGEGGQNRIGTEQGDLMGVIRTHELLEARRIDGGEQAFASVVDFGYTKTPEEALAIWGAERLLRDMVKTIRSIRPDVIVSRFPPRPGSGGHGQHTAVGWTGPEAFEAAADPDRFPELGLPPWQTRRYYYNVPSFGRRGGRPGGSGNGNLTMELGSYDPVLGKSYAEIAGESRSMHRSQAMGTSERKGSVSASFRYVAGDRAESGLFAGIDMTWGRIPGSEGVAKSIAFAQERYDPRDPAAIVPHLTAAWRELSKLSGPEVEYKRSQLRRALELASGVWLDATADRWDAVPGSTINIDLRALRRSDAAWTWRSTRIEGAAEATVAGGGELAANRVQERSASLAIPEGSCYTQPHWLRSDAERAAGCTDIDVPGIAPVLRAVFEFEAPGGVPVEFEKPVLYRWVDRSIGERSRPLALVPPVTVAFASENRIFPQRDPAQIPVRLASNQDGAEARVRLEAPDGWGVSPATRDVKFARRGQERTVTFEVTPPAEASGGELSATATVAGVTVRSGMRTIEYDHIPTTPVFPRAAMRVERFDVRLLAREIGYVMGAGDKIPDALAQLGANVTLLSSEDLAVGDLQRFDAVVTGIRALNTREDLLAARERLLEFVEQGGTLVVQYNTSSFRGGGAPTVLGPYPLTASRLRVTDERAAVTATDDGHPLLSAPNQIVRADFDGWVQERGLYFMSDWDERYDSVLSSADPGEDPLGGGMLYTRYGRGAYVFTAYSWFRQLPAGVPGAYRIFANVISAGKALRSQ